MKEIAVKTLMSLSLVATLGAAMVVSTTGCASKKKTKVSGLPLSGTVTDISPTAPAPVAYAPAQPTFEPASPVTTYTPAPAGAPPVQVATGGGSYTVKKGETLFSIAKSQYGNGKQWQRIASANPGLSPATLKAGQTIVLP